MEEMKSCHRLDVPKKMLNSIQDSQRSADNSDFRAFDKQGKGHGPLILVPAQVCLEGHDQEQDELDHDPDKNPNQVCRGQDYQKQESSSRRSPGAG